VDTIPITAINVNGICPEKMPKNHFAKPTIENHSKKNFRTSKLKYMDFEKK